jgi:hypothetical protein
MWLLERSALTFSFGCSLLASSRRFVAGETTAVFGASI